ncbi:MAG: hypothetical protein PF542_00695 [Nanoarchaeota archaeon]|jgi:hypothetical protein|nr:hypothetical protein [Nanoarchaeota archaeon]
MTTISIIGPGNTEFYYQTLQKVTKTKFDSQIKQIAKVLAQTNSTLELLPDKGIALDIGIEYKFQGGKKIIGIAPLSDKKVGIKHLEQYMNLKIDNKKIFNKIQDGGDWAKTNQTKGLFGNAILYLGNTFGTQLELNSSLYIYKWHHDNKRFPLNSINKNLIAGKEFPLTIIVYSPFLKSGKLEYETEQYLKKEGIKLIYVKSPAGLKKAIESFK